MQREGVIVENLLHAVLHVPLLPRSNRRIGIVGIIYGRAMDSKMARDSISIPFIPFLEKSSTSICSPFQIRELMTKRTKVIFEEHLWNFYFVISINNENIV